MTIIFNTTKFLLLLAFLSLPTFALDKVNHAVGVFLSPQGENFFTEHLAPVLKANGLNLSDLDFDQFSLDIPEAPLEELIPSNQIGELILQARDTIQRYFDGFELKNNHFKIDLKDIQLKAHWTKEALTFVHPAQGDGTTGVILQLEFTAASIQTQLGSVLASDLNNEILGTYGINQLLFNLPDVSNFPLQITVAAHLFFDEKKHLKVIVDPPSTNLSEIPLTWDFASPLIFPPVSIVFNNHPITLNLNRLEKGIREQGPKILQELQTYLSNWIADKAGPMLAKSFNDKISSGITEVNEMLPVGAPANSTDPNYRWYLSFEHLDSEYSDLHFGLDGLITDPRANPDPPFPAKLNANAWPSLKNYQKEKYDLILTLNQGLINRVLQLSFLRGYFDKMQVGSGPAIQLAHQPILRVKSKGCYFELEIIYHVSGFASLFVHNPVHINFNALLNFPVKNGQAQMTMADFDMNSLFVDDRYIRFFAGKVRKSLRAQFEKLRPEIKDYVLSESMPIPNTLGGINLKIIKIVPDDSGHLLVFLNLISPED